MSRTQSVSQKIRALDFFETLSEAQAAARLLWLRMKYLGNKFGAPDKSRGNCLPAYVGLVDAPGIHRRSPSPSISHSPAPPRIFTCAPLTILMVDFKMWTPR